MTAVWIAEQAWADGSSEIIGVYASLAIARASTHPERNWEHVSPFTGGQWWECGSVDDGPDDGCKITRHEVQP